MKSDKYILKDHEAIPTDNLEEWGRMFNNKDRIVKQETLPNGKRVSTVFLGLNYNWGEGEPLLFETMVFNPDEIDMERYSTWEEAEKGHKRMVKKYL